MIGQLRGQFPLPPADGMNLQPGDLGQQARPTMTDTVRFQTGVPAPVRFRQLIEKQNHLAMPPLTGMLTRLPAILTLTRSLWRPCRCVHRRRSLL
jgi:hypothetical protein